MQLECCLQSWLHMVKEGGGGRQLKRWRTRFMTGVIFRELRERTKTIGNSRGDGSPRRAIKRSRRKRTYQGRQLDLAIRWSDPIGNLCWPIDVMPPTRLFVRLGLLETFENSTKQKLTKSKYSQTLKKRVEKRRKEIWFYIDTFITPWRAKRR